MAPPRSLPGLSGLWQRSSQAIRNHPGIARFIGNDKPHLWQPRRRSVALGAGIGAAISIVPLPAQVVLAALAAIRFRAHLPTTVAMTFLSNPLSTLPLLGVAWMLGGLCLGQPAEWAYPAQSLTAPEFKTWLFNASQPLLIGIPLLSMLLGVFSFAVTHIGWRYAVVNKRRNRRTTRRARHDESTG